MSTEPVLPTCLCGGGGGGGESCAAQGSIMGGSGLRNDGAGEGAR